MTVWLVLALGWMTLMIVLGLRETIGNVLHSIRQGKERSDVLLEESQGMGTVLAFGLIPLLLSYHLSFWWVAVSVPAGVVIVWLEILYAERSNAQVETSRGAGDLLELTSPEQVMVMFRCAKCNKALRWGEESCRACGALVIERWSNLVRLSVLFFSPIVFAVLIRIVTGALQLEEKLELRQVYISIVALFVGGMMARHEVNRDGHTARFRIEFQKSMRLREFKRVWSVGDETWNSRNDLTLRELLSSLQLRRLASKIEEDLSEADSRMVVTMRTWTIDPM